MKNLKCIPVDTIITVTLISLMTVRLIQIVTFSVNFLDK